MKAYIGNNTKTIQLFTIILFLAIFIAGCSSTKYIANYQSIVKKVKIDSVAPRFEEEAYGFVQKEIRPSSEFSLNTIIYNTFNTKNGKYKTNNISSLGNSPAILDSTLVEISRDQIQKFLLSKGYFKATVNAEISIKNKKAKVVFLAKPGPAFFINKISYAIADTALKNIYLSHKKMFTRLNSGMQYDEDSIAYEREQIFLLMQENGYKNFVRPYINFEVDSGLNNNMVNLKININNPVGASKHQAYTIGNAKIVIAPNTDGFLDTATLNKQIINGLTFTDLSKKFKAKPIVRYNFIKKGELFNLRKENLTYDRLYELNVFKNVRIDYTKAKDSSATLEPEISLIPQKRMSNRIEGEIPFNAGLVGLNISNTYIDNNFLKGAERFELQFRAGLQSRNVKTFPLFNDIFQRDFSISSSLSFPELLLPFNVPLMGKNGMPRTTFSASYVYVLRKEFVRKTILNSISYDFVETKSKLHSVTPLSFEYRFGNLLLDTNTVDGKNTLNANSYNIRLLSRKDLTLGIKYTFSLNANKLNANSNFIYFKGNIDMAGNLLQLASKITGNNANPAIGDYAKVFGLPFNQYVKPEIDVRLYKRLNVDEQFIARINAGVGYAYGNSRAIPFEKLFFAGGANGIRAWQARTLGPGNYNRSVIASEAARNSSFGLDQLGQMHLETNFEYRYLITNKFWGGKLKGAAFVDAGNIWNIASGNQQLETYFNFKNLANQIAIGAGLGLRQDWQYFVLRFDLGIKIKDPQFQTSEQWVIGKYFTGGKTFKEDYRRTNAPDRYRFLQYNFGIGLPF